MRIWIGSAISQERSLWILDPPLLQPEIIGHPESPTGFRGRTAIYRRFFQHEDLRAVLGSRKCGNRGGRAAADRSEEHTSELQSLMRISYPVFCLKKITPHHY